MVERCLHPEIASQGAIFHGLGDLGFAGGVVAVEPDGSRTDLERWLEVRAEGLDYGVAAYSDRWAGDCIMRRLAGRVGGSLMADKATLSKRPLR